MRCKVDCSYTLCITTLGARKGGWSAKHASRFTPMESSGNPLRRLGGPQVRYERISEKRGSLAPPVFKTWTVQPIESHYAGNARRTM
jgi:hypothetical protein